MKLKAVKITEKRVESDGEEYAITYSVKLSDKDGDNTMTIRTGDKPDYAVGSEFELRKIAAQTRLTGKKE